MSKVTIIRHGTDTAYIKYNEESNLVLDFAVQELQKYVKMISGCILKVCSDKSIVDKPVVIELIIDNEQKLNNDGFYVEVKNNKVMIVGTNARGVLYGVYSLLEKLGCIWIYPLEEEQFIPKKKTLQLEIGKWQEQPYMKCRGLTLYGTYKETIKLTRSMIDWMAKNRYNLLMTSVNKLDDAVCQCHTINWLQLEDELLYELKKRGIQIHMSEHSTDYFFSKSLFDKHPDWFAFIDGKRMPQQICYSNKEAVEYFKNAYIKYIKKHPEIDMIGIWPLDGRGYCECENCKDSETIFKAINYIAGEIKKIRPDLTVEHLAYQPESFTIPTISIQDNMSVLVCSRTDEVAEEWSKTMKSNRGAYYFEYNTGDHYRWIGNLWLNPYYAKYIVNTFINMEYSGIISLFLPIQSWWVSCFNYYFLRLAYWNPNFNVEEELLKYCTKIYGELNTEVIFKIFQMIFKELQDKGIWHLYPFSLAKNNKEVCSIEKYHKIKFNNVLLKIKKLLCEIQEEKMNKMERLNYKRLKSYIKYKEIYYNLVDTYDQQMNTYEDVEKLFKYVDSLDKDIKCVFAPSEYIKWRILGRDAVI